MTRRLLLMNMIYSYELRPLLLWVVSVHSLLPELILIFLFSLLRHDCVDWLHFWIACPYWNLSPTMWFISQAGLRCILHHLCTVPAPCICNERQFSKTARLQVINPITKKRIVQNVSGLDFRSTERWQRFKSWHLIAYDKRCILGSVFVCMNLDGGRS